MPSPLTKTIAVCSNKGGVGKSTIALSLARALKKNGKVAILDLDFASPCLQIMTKTKSNIEVSKEGFKPALTQDGMEIFSLGLLINKEDTPVMIRGAKRAEIVVQILQDIKWNSPSYLICDLPSGIQEETLALLRNLKPKKVVIVIQPHKLSLASAKRMASALKKLKIKKIYLLENMASMLCPSCGADISLFNGDGKELAKSLNVKYLGAVPFVPFNKKGTVTLKEEIMSELR